MASRVRLTRLGERSTRRHAGTEPVFARSWRDFAAPFRLSQNGGRRRRAVRALSAGRKRSCEQARTSPRLFDVSAAVEELCTPECSASASRLIQLSPGPLRFQKPRSLLLHLPLLLRGGD